SSRRNRRTVRTIVPRGTRRIRVMDLSDRKGRANRRGAHFKSDASVTDWKRVSLSPGAGGWSCGVLRESRCSTFNLAATRRSEGEGRAPQKVWAARATRRRATQHRKDLAAQIARSLATSRAREAQETDPKSVNG